MNLEGSKTCMKMQVLEPFEIEVIIKLIQLINLLAHPRIYL